MTKAEVAIRILALLSENSRTTHDIQSKTGTMPVVDDTMYEMRCSGLIAYSSPLWSITQEGRKRLAEDHQKAG